MIRNNLEELLSVLEEIRKEKYPEISSELINQIVQTQYDNQDKRLEARTQTNKIVAEFLSEKIQEKEVND